MDFELSSDQEALRDGVRALCEGRFTIESIRGLIDGDYLDRGRWRELADTGVFSLVLPEDAGGVGLGYADAVVVFEELGRALVPGPLVGSFLAAGVVEGASSGDAIVGLVERPRVDDGFGDGRQPPAYIEFLGVLDALLVIDDDGVWQVDVAPGIRVEMNTASDIHLFTAGRAVTGMRLRSGEAVIHIDPSRRASFTVQVADATVVSAPGSAFALRCHDEATSVTCLEGQTELTWASTTTRVKPSQQVDVDANGLSAPVAVNPGTALAWRRRVLIYDNQRLADVVADINRYRPGRIVITDRALAERRVHARFTLAQMSDVTTLIQDAYGAHATHLPGGWVLLS